MKSKYVLALPQYSENIAYINGVPSIPKSNQIPSIPRPNRGRTQHTAYDPDGLNLGVLLIMVVIIGFCLAIIFSGRI